MSENENFLIGRFRRLSPLRRGLLVVLALSFGLLILVRAAKRASEADTGSSQSAISKKDHAPSAPDVDLKAEWQRMNESSRMVAPRGVAVPGASSAGVVDGMGYEGPLISQAAELAVTTKEFTRSRTNLEEILERHHGYASKLRMVGQPSGSTLTATLRIPSTEFNAAVTDLKTLGNVEREEQMADEITQQEADLEARLSNARNTLQRLQERMPKFGTASDLQRQLSAVSAEITRLEAQRTAWQNRIIFANVLFSLREEITPTVESFGSQFRKAALTGLSDALSSISAMVLFAVSYGPAIFVWILLLLFPGRWIWKKWRPTVDSEAPHPAQNI